MNVLLVMIPLSIVLLIGAAIAFFWAVDHGQFDDMDTPGLLPLDDSPCGRDNGRDHSAESRDNRQPQ
jgi:cbb3-type cytochrome oxidase maturation protein